MFLILLHFGDSMPDVRTLNSLTVQVF